MSTSSSEPILFVVWLVMCLEFISLLACLFHSGETKEEKTKGLQYEYSYVLVVVVVHLFEFRPCPLLQEVQHQGLFKLVDRDEMMLTIE